MKNKSHWVFDLDGTLVDSISFYFASLRAVLGSFNIKVRDEDLARSLTMFRNDFLAIYLSPDQVPLASVEIQRQSEVDVSDISVFPGIEKSLEFLQKKKIKMAVWTGRDLKSAEMILQQTKLAKYFDFCIGGTCVSKHKPDPEGLALTIQRWNCAARDLVMVGDHEVDIHGAKALDVFNVRVSWGQKTAKKCELSNLQFFHVQDFHHFLQSEVGP